MLFLYMLSAHLSRRSQLFFAAQKEAKKKKQLSYLYFSHDFLLFLYASESYNT